MAGGSLASEREVQETFPHNWPKRPQPNKQKLTASTDNPSARAVRQLSQRHIFGLLFITDNGREQEGRESVNVEAFVRSLGLYQNWFDNSFHNKSILLLKTGAESTPTLLQSELYLVLQTRPKSVLYDSICGAVRKQAN